MLDGLKKQTFQNPVQASGPREILSVALSCLWVLSFIPFGEETEPQPRPAKRRNKGNVVFLVDAGGYCHLGNAKLQK